MLFQPPHCRVWPQVSAESATDRATTAEDPRGSLCHGVNIFSSTNAPSRVTPMPQKATTSENRQKQFPQIRLVRSYLLQMVPIHKSGPWMACCCRRHTEPHECFCCFLDRPNKATGEKVLATILTYSRKIWGHLLTLNTSPPILSQGFSKCAEFLHHKLLSADPQLWSKSSNSESPRDTTFWTCSPG